MQAAIERGQWTFPAPLGYRRITTSNGRSMLEPDPKLAPFVRKAFELFATGVYDREHVLRILTADAFRNRNGNRIPSQTFCRILTNPIYIGRIVVPKWKVDCLGAFEPIVQTETFDRVQAILRGKRPTLKPRLRSNPAFPLRHFVACGACGKPLTGSSSKGRSRYYAYYHCPKHSCRAPNIKKAELESAFLALIEKLQPRPAYVNLFSEIVLDVWNERRKDGLKIEAALTKRIEELKARKQRVVDAFLHDRVIDRVTYQQQVERLDEEITLADLELHDTKLEDLDIEAALNFATHALNNAAQFWIECLPDQKERFQRILFPEGLRFEPQGFGTPVTCLAFSYLREISSGDSSLASRTGVEPVSPP